jgi:hypothetical protein
MRRRFLSAVLAVLISTVISGCEDQMVIIPSDTCSFAGITAVNAAGDTLSLDPEDWCPGATSPDSLVPDTHSFGPAYPNPTSGWIRIRFGLATPGSVRIILISPACGIIRTLTDETLAAGQHVVEWDGTDEDGDPVEPGIYRCQMTASTYICQGDIEIRR